jgi:hypothetical protein
MRTRRNRRQGGRRTEKSEGRVSPHRFPGLSSHNRSSIALAEGNFLQPKILGTALNMPSILIFLAVIAGGEIAGLLGVIFAVPTLAVLKVLFDFFRARLYTED